ncbi:MAG: serine hydrolase [Cyanobacteria bacterium P01_A01_bin.116]
MVQVSLSATAGSDNLNRLIEDEGTVASLTFSLDESPPASGLTLGLDSPELSEFDVAQIQITGGEFAPSKTVETQLEGVLASRLSTAVPGGAIATSSPLGNWSGAAGLANIETDTPVSPDDRFEVGSVTKTFTATTLLKLVEAGTVTLGDRLTDWLPDSVTDNVPNASDITLRQLLNHTSGVPEYDSILLEQGMSNPLVFLQDWQPSAIVGLIADSAPFFAPGEGWQYANTNFVLAGMVIEAATGNSLANEIQSKIIDPLGLNNTFFSTTKEMVPGGYINGYLDFDNSGTLDDVSIANLSWTWAAGAIVSNADDLTQYARSLYAGDLLSDETRADMFTLVDTGRGYEYGLGMMSFDTPELGRIVGHRGGSLGFNANMWYSPEDDFTYVELLNGRTEEALATDTIPAFRNGPIVDIGNTSDYDQFKVTLTDQTAQVLLPVANDGISEGEEIVTFALEASADYTIAPSGQTTALTIVDTTVDTDPDSPPGPNVPVIGTGESETIVGDDAENTIDSKAGDDTIAGGLGSDLILGDAGDDVLRGDLNERAPQDEIVGGNDIIFGGEGNDRIGGKAGNDILSGDAGDDFIWGDDGNDIIMGGTGNDTLVGDNSSDGSGSDLFVFGNGDGTDTIVDFEVGTDRIGLVAGELTFADLTFTQDGVNALLGVSESSEVLAILNNVQASALDASSFETVADVSTLEEAMALI